MIQFRQSSIEPVQNPLLCSGARLRLNDWVLVRRDWIIPVGTGQPCPAHLTGGFSVRIYDRRNRRDVCDVYEGTTRVEAQCGAGDEDAAGGGGSIVFRFRYPECVPDGLDMSVEQRSFCVASWTQDESTFSVLRHDANERFWCLRYQTSYANSVDGGEKRFIAYLFTRLACNREIIPKETVDYLMMDMRLETPWPAIADVSGIEPSSLCADDYEQCSWENVCVYQHARFACARRCGLCAEIAPRWCRMPSWIVGEWRDSDANRTLVVDEDVLTLYSATSENRYRCVRWGQHGGVRQAVRKDRHGARIAELMLVETFRNGCRPRYVCVQWKLLHRSASSVLKYRFSRSQIWPFQGLSLNRTSVDCALFQYDEDDDNATNNDAPVLFHAVVQSGSDPLDCDTAGVAEDEKLLIFGNRERCSGRLRYFNDRGRVKLRIAPFACPGRSRWLDFTCVEINHNSTETLIVTYVEQYSEYHCWIYRRNSSSSLSPDVYVLRIVDCTEAALDRIDDGTLEPVISIHEYSPTTPDYDRVGTSDKIVDPDDQENSTAVKEEDFWTADEFYEEFANVSDRTTTMETEETELVAGVVNGKRVNEGNASVDEEETVEGGAGRDNRSYQAVDSAGNGVTANRLLEKDDNDDRKQKDGNRTFGVNKNYKRHEHDQDVKSDKSAKNVHLTTTVFPPSTAFRQTSLVSVTRKSSGSTKITSLSKHLDRFDIASDGKTGGGGGVDEDVEEEEEGEDGSADDHSDSRKTTSRLRHLADDIELVDGYHGNRTTVSVMRGNGFDEDSPTGGGASQRRFDDVIVTSAARVSRRPISAASSASLTTTPRQTFFNYSSFAVLSTVFLYYSLTAVLVVGGLLRPRRR